MFVEMFVGYYLTKIRNLVMLIVHIFGLLYLVINYLVQKLNYLIQFYSSRKVDKNSQSNLHYFIGIYNDCKQQNSL